MKSFLLLSFCIFNILDNYAQNSNPPYISDDRSGVSNTFNEDNGTMYHYSYVKNTGGSGNINFIDTVWGSSNNASVAYAEKIQFSLQSNSRYKITSKFSIEYKCNDLKFSESFSGTPGYKLSDDFPSQVSFSNGQMNCIGYSATSGASSSLELVGTTNVAIDQSVQYDLKQNYPNPFNQTTTIPFSISTQSYVSLIIYDQIGKEVATIVSQILPAGEYNKYWNAVDMPSGIYFYRLQAGSFTGMKKLILIK
jgi:hypothetical protein